MREAYQSKIGKRILFIILVTDYIYVVWLHLSSLRIRWLAALKRQNYRYETENRSRSDETVMTLLLTEVCYAK